MEENSFWLSLWKSVILGICILILCVTGNCQNSKYQLRKMIEAGTDPILAACALGKGYGTDCILRIAQDK